MSWSPCCFVLQGNLGLVDLNLSWNKLRPKGVMHLAEGLTPNLNVQVCALWGSCCGCECCGVVHHATTSCL
jgi:hypothetical protein